MAIDSRGDERRRVQLRPGVSYDRAMAWLQQLLERVDPLPSPPKLELVRDTPARRRERKLHPAHENDRRAYLRRRVTQLAMNVRVFRD